MLISLLLPAAVQLEESVETREENVLNFFICFPVWSFSKLISNVGENVCKKQSDFHRRVKVLSHFNKTG